jgi:type II secretory pathway pseudopilin PulG
MNTQFSKSRGLSLVEVLVALVMLGAVILVSAGLILPLSVTRDSNTETQALTYARSYIELVRQWWLEPAKFEASPSDGAVNPVWPTAGSAAGNDLRLPTGWTLTKTATIRAGSGRYSDANSNFAASSALRRYRDTLRDVTITINPNNGAKSIAVSTVIALTNP